jgi:hypothetical protein
MRHPRRNKTHRIHTFAQITEPKNNAPKWKKTPPPLNQIDAKYIQAVMGTLLYYGRAVDSTILPALSAIATKQAKPTAKTMAMVKKLLDYCTSQEEAIMTFKASDMVLQVHSNAGYANEKMSRGQAGGHFTLLNKDTSPPNNGTILTTATIIKSVMLSAAEAKLGALFINAKKRFTFLIYSPKWGTRNRAHSFRQTTPPLKV